MDTPDEDILMSTAHSSALPNNTCQLKDDLGDMTFCMSNYAKEALKMMYMMRQVNTFFQSISKFNIFFVFENLQTKHHMLTDCILEVENELFHVHKVVLSSASPYFKAMFTGGLKECEMSRVKLQGVCPTSMARIISFMYTGRIRVTVRSRSSLFR